MPGRPPAPVWTGRLEKVSLAAIGRGVDRPVRATGLCHISNRSPARRNGMRWIPHAPPSRAVSEIPAMKNRDGRNIRGRPARRRVTIPLRHSFEQLASERQ
jgi:hypothetical protein